MYAARTADQSFQRKAGQDLADTAEEGHLIFSLLVAEIHKIGGHAANSYWISYFIIIIPGLIAGWLGYYFGIRNFHLTRILIAETPEEAEKKRVEKEKHNK